MKKILKFTQFPPGPVPEGYIYYNRTTREVKLNTNFGERTYGATYIPSDIDALSINGYYPLYRNEALAKQVSPNNIAVLYDQSNLLTAAPPGVVYPLYMPLGVGTYQGNHIDPGGDSDGDGILNFRDPDIVGLNALPGAGYNGIDPFSTSGGSSVNIKDYLENPDPGTLNNTNEDILVAIGSSGIIVGPGGETEYFFGPGSAVLKPGWILFEDEGSTESPLPKPSPSYNGKDPFISPNGALVNIKDYIEDPDEGSNNDTNQPILINVVKPGIIVCADGSVSYFLAGSVSVNPECTMFLDQTTDKTSPLPEPSPIYSGTDPFTTSIGDDVNIKDYLDDPDSGSLNDTGSDISVQVTEESIIVLPGGTVQPVTSVPSSIILPPGAVLFSNKSSFVEKLVTSKIITPDLGVESTSSSLQWFESDSSNNLSLRASSFDSSNPAIQFWEEASAESYTPRDSDYSSNTESAQYFEENSDGNIHPTDSPN